jgi:hypothetical protein
MEGSQFRAVAPTSCGGEKSPDLSSKNILWAARLSFPKEIGHFIREKL